MKAADFDYERPDDIDTALALLAQSDRDPALLAGGQSLMPMMNFRMAQPGLLIDLGGIDRLRGIFSRPDHVGVGAMAPYCDLAASEDIATHVPLLAMALPHIAHEAIRNRGTIGGSLALADPAAELPAMALALDAIIHVQGLSGPRDIPADDMFLGTYETSLNEGELITAVSFPKATDDDRFGFHEITRRHGDYAMAGVAISHTRSGHRIAFFGVSDRPMRSRTAEAILDENPTATKAACAALDDLDIQGDLNGNEKTKRHLAGVTLRNALSEMVQ